MSFRHLVRVGRRWVNPWFVVEIEDPSRPNPPPEGDLLNVTVVPGKSFSVTGEDAAKLRRLLEDDDPGRQGSGVPEPHWPPPEPGEGPPADPGNSYAGQSGSSLHPPARPIHTRETGAVVE